MLKYLGLISGLTTLATINFVSAAIAQTATVTFSGTVLPQASFSEPVFRKPEAVSSFGSINTSNELQSVNTTKLSLETHEPVNISISSSVENQDNMTFKLGSKGVTNIMANGESVSLPPGKTDLEMNMLLEKPEASVQGNNHIYNVTITLTP